jgi:hypothetical protein
MFGKIIGIGALLLATPLAASDVPRVLRLEDKLEVGDMLVIGEAELVGLPEIDAIWRARIDSGATTTSVHAVDIEQFERDGEPWVRFALRNEKLDTQVALERPVTRIAQIQRRGTDEMQKRPVVELDVSIGDLVTRIEVNLTDRTHFEFPVLIGRNFLSGQTLIDVSRAYLHGNPKKER